MAIVRKVRQIGNSLALPVPKEVFEFLEFDPQKVKYKLCQDETGSVYVLILQKGVIALDEKKFQKLGTSYSIIIPKSLCIMWNIGLSEGQNRELSLSYGDSPLQWYLAPL